MGSVDILQSATGKVFAGICALYYGLIGLVAMKSFVAPIVRRLLHHFYLDSDNQQKRWYFKLF